MLSAISCYFCYLTCKRKVNSFALFCHHCNLGRASIFILPCKTSFCLTEWMMGEFWDNCVTFSCSKILKCNKILCVYIISSILPKLTKNFDDSRGLVFCSLLDVPISLALLISPYLPWLAKLVSFISGKVLFYLLASEACYTYLLTEGRIFSFAIFNI